MWNTLFIYVLFPIIVYMGFPFSIVKKIDELFTSISIKIHLKDLSILKSEKHPKMLRFFEKEKNNISENMIINHIKQFGILLFQGFVIILIITLIVRLQRLNLNDKDTIAIALFLCGIYRLYKLKKKKKKLEHLSDALDMYPNKNHNE